MASMAAEAAAATTAGAPAQPAASASPAASSTPSLAAAVTAPPPLQPVVLTYGRHKWPVAVPAAPPGNSVGDVKHALHDGLLPGVPVAWMRVLAGGGKELPDSASVVDDKTRLKNSKRENPKPVKLKLNFARDFAALGQGKREALLAGGGGGGGGVARSSNSGSGSSGGGGNSVGAAAAAASLEAAVSAVPRDDTTPSVVEDEPAAWVLQATVTHGKAKHVFYFADEDSATVGQLRERVASATGAAPRRQRLIGPGGCVLGADPVRGTASLPRGITSDNGAAARADAASLLGFVAGAGGGSGSKTKTTKQKRRRLKVRLLFDARYHDQAAATRTLTSRQEGGLAAQLAELEKEVGGLHRKVTHNFFDAAQLIVHGRNYVEDIDALEGSVAALRDAGAGARAGGGSGAGSGGGDGNGGDIVQTAAARLARLREMSEEIERRVQGAMGRKR